MGKRIAIIVAALLLLAAAGTFYVLAYTQTGIELAAVQLSKLDRLGIHVTGVSGRLTGPIHIDRFELDNERAHVVVEDITIDLHLRWLALQTIDITALTARTATVELKTVPDEPPPETQMRFLPGFLRIAVNRAELMSVTLTTAAGQVITADRVQTAVRLRSEHLWLDDLAILSPLFTAQGDFELLAGRPVGLRFTGTGTLPQGDRPDLNLAATVAGTPDSMQFTADLRAPSAAQVKGRFTRPQGQWRVEGQATSAAFSLEPWMERPPFSLTNVALDFSAQPEAIRVNGDLTVPEFDPQPLRLEASGRYTDRTLVFTTAELRQTQGTARLKAGGRVAFVEGGPALNVAAEWTGIRWPLAGAEPLVTSPVGQLTLSGPLPYQFNVSATVAGQRIPNARGVVSGSLSREQLVITRYQIAALDGTMTGAGTLELSQPRRWTLSTTASDIDPSVLFAEFPGKIALTATATGKGLDTKADFVLAVARLQGQLRGQPLNGNGQVERDAAGWRIQNTALTLGESRLTASGTLRDMLDLRWTFTTNSLGDLVPNSQGRVRLDGSATGPLKTPHVVADVNGAGLKYADWSIGSISGKANVDLAGIAPSDLAIEARNLGSGGLRAEALSLAGQGNADAHSLDLELKSGSGTETTTAKLAITGRYADQTWTGEIASGRLDNPDGSQAVGIKEPAHVVISRDRADVERLCLFLVDSSVCGNGRWQRNGAWQVDATAEDMPLDVLRLVLRNPLRYLGTMDMQLTASGSPGVPWTGATSVVLTGGAVVYQLLSDDEKTTETIQIGSGRADLRATAENITATVGLANEAETFIAANATLTRVPGTGFGELPLTGRIRARMGDANLLPLLVAEIDNAGGVLNADVAVSGRMNAPQLDGRIELNQGELDLYRVNLALRQLEIAVTLAANQLEFKGSGHAGEGTFNLGGTLAWKNSLPAGTLELKGENLLVADLPEYRVVAAPDLHFLIDGRTIAASGEVFIPSARIQPTDLSGAVQISPDSRLLQEKPAEIGSNFSVSSEIRIRLGDDVQLDTFGLQGKLAGSVGTTTSTGDIAVGRGELSVSNGKYEAYGQNLDIARGRLLFDASPLDDPGLDIQAERTIDTVKVGLNVRGTLREPRFGFYSEPSMTQTQIMSYLLVGKPIDDLQNRDTAAVGSARDTLALQGGGLIAAQLGRRLGLGQVGVETNSANDTSLVLGRFLSPRLFVSYGISLTESINTLKLRYTISDRWVLKTEAGEDQSADVEFTIERP